MDVEETGRRAGGQAKAPHAPVPTFPGPEPSNTPIPSASGDAAQPPVGPWSRDRDAVALRGPAGPDHGLSGRPRLPRRPRDPDSPPSLGAHLERRVQIGRAHV